MKIPVTLDQAVREAIGQLVGDAEPRYLEAVSGGCINECMHLQVGEQDFFLKYNHKAMPGLFTAEAEGLAKLAATKAVRIPEVYAVMDGDADKPAFLLLEWIEQSKHLDQSALGEQLASLHSHSAPQYGFASDGYIGANPQVNGWKKDWIDFFRDRRLRPQVEMAVKTGLLDRWRRTSLDKMMMRLEKWLGGVEQGPALLHGDLWGGNVIATAGGQPVLIDPAVYYGVGEAELAFTTLFGGFSERFYQAYQSVRPLKPGYKDRFQIYNLYHLLNHLNLFGESYGGQVDAILRRFVA